LQPAIGLTSETNISNIPLKKSQEMKKLFTTSVWLMALGFGAFGQPLLNSHPAITATTATIYLDFNGETVTSSVWNGGNTINAASPGLTDAQVTEIFHRVSEDYRPFDVNITTDLAKFLAAPFDKRIRVVVTPTSAWRPGVGGIAWTGSFTWGDDTPCFVFSDRLGPNNPKMVAEACSHEAGHTLGLSHQSRYDGNCAMTESYHTGSGTGESSWAPVMGNSYYRNMSGWNDGPTQFGCASTQDNLSIITTQNGFGYRADDFGAAMNATATTLNPTSFTTSGIIAENNDQDVFRLTLPSATAMRIQAVPFSIGANNDGANLDIKLELHGSAGQLLRVYDPQSTMGIAVDSVLAAGTYYLVLDGSGNTNTGDYGSLGSYTLSGFSGTLPIRNVALTGISDNGRHQLNWSIVADEAIRNIAVEVSANGTNFTELTNVNAQVNRFTYSPFEKTDLHYRLKVTSVIGQTVYSNTMVLKGTGKNNQSFTISTLVTNEVVVNAADNFQYRICNANGQVTAQGNGKRGMNRIDWHNKPAGMYVIQLMSNNDKLTERIIKQ
jgi:hypothetical protein